MVGVSVRTVFFAVGALAAATATAGEPDEFRLRFFGADLEREGGRRDGPVVKVKFGLGSKLNDQAIAELKNFSGIRHLDLAGRPVRSGLFDAIRDMKDLEYLHMPSEPRDDEFAVVAGMPKLRELWVVVVGYGPGVTDDGVKALRELNEMRKLRLWSNKVTDAGLKHIAGLTKLTELELVGTKITDAGMPLVATFTELERLDLRSAAASRDQQVRKRGEHGKPTPETALPNRGRRFYLHTFSPSRVGGFAYLRISSKGITWAKQAVAQKSSIAILPTKR